MDLKKIRIRKHVDGHVAINVPGTTIGEETFWHMICRDGITCRTYIEADLTSALWSEVLVVDLPGPDGRTLEGTPTWTASCGATVTPYPGGVSFDGDEPEDPNVTREDALKVLAAVAVAERSRDAGTGR